MVFLAQRTGHEALDYLAKQPMNGTALFLSVTMAARRYTPGEKNAYLSEMLKSNETLLVDVVDYCKKGNYELGFSEKDPVGPFYSSTKEERFIAFDDSRSIAVKFCQGKKYRTSLKYGIAVFDVEMDDPENKCGEGSYARLKSIRKLVDYMNNNFTSPSGFSNCAK
ncbi:hypothetical protein V5799_020431 [Amblyomma americanum]|uniref:Uncharacterized protein n=1 Tax=Amblyomma americanum TaxID=6943 RepID=A0AAQ4ETV0_AMBAM